MKPLCYVVMTLHPCFVSNFPKYFSPHNTDRTRGAFLFHLRLKNFLKPSHIGNMARRLKKSKIRGKFFNKEKSLYKGNMARRAYGAPFAKNLPLRSDFSGLLRLPPRSPNTQNSSAATPPSRCCFLKTAHVEKHKKNENTLQSLRDYAIIQKHLTEGRRCICFQQYPIKPAI